LGLRDQANNVIQKTDGVSFFFYIDHTVIHHCRYEDT
jgi:hypothetical protein